MTAARSELRQVAMETRDVTLRIAVDASRPDDRVIAEKIAAALLRLDLTAEIEAVDPVAFARRVASGACDLYVGQLAALSSDPAIATAAAFAVAGDAWPARALARRALGLDAVESAFRERLPVVPLFHRAVRVHYRDQLRGVGFGALGRIRLADLFGAPS